jgi:hypothetical protein
MLLMSNAHRCIAFFRMCVGGLINSTYSSHEHHDLDIGIVVV